MEDPFPILLVVGGERAVGRIQDVHGYQLSLFCPYIDGFPSLPLLSFPIYFLPNTLTLYRDGSQLVILNCIWIAKAFMYYANVRQNKD
jgi:hypothetical protein